MNLDRPTPSSFEDPALKTAVRQAWEGERAPADLRRRVMTALAHEDLLGSSTPVAESLSTKSPAFWRRPAFGWSSAAAAVILVGIGLAASDTFSAKSDRVTTATATAGATPAATFPADLANALVRTHNGCLRAHPTDHHLFVAAPKGDMRVIAQAMSARLKHPVVTTSMDDGWAFRGAAICPVGSQKAAHLVYARDDAAISIFSLPASVALSSCADRQDCEAALDGHPMAGFVENGGFYCVVATSGKKSAVDAQQVKALRDQLHGHVIAAAQSHPAPEALVASMAR
jgi:hypothetical protein